MPNYGSTKQNTGGAKSGASQPASKNYDAGSMGGFGNSKGARKSLPKSPGCDHDQWPDTDNAQSGEGFGGGMTKPRAGGY